MSKQSATKLPTQASNASIFITNIRLLDFDQYDDWPLITAQILTGKDAQQNQKKRIQCVEWALYRLFELWDPEETRNVGLGLGSIHESHS